MLEPVQIAGQLLGNVTFASGREADHDNDQLGADILADRAFINLLVLPVECEQLLSISPD
jgi:hypothetical protein